MNITEQEFSQLVADNEGRLRNLCRVYADSEADQEDIFQEILIQIWHSLPSFNGNAKIETWIYRLAINTAISFVRKKQTRQKYRSKFKEQQEFEPNRGIIFQESEDQQVVTLYNAISELNPSEKAIITMYLEDFSYAEISFVTDISENYVGVKLHRIKKKLSNIIEEENEA